MPNLTYPPVGHENLAEMSRLHNFCDWMYGVTIKPFLRGNILELGSGLGDYSERIIRDFRTNKIYLSDADKTFVTGLESRFGNQRNVTCYRIDLENSEDFRQIDCDIDSAVAVNVIEHVRDDLNALRNVNRAMRKHGTLVVLVPAYRFLYNCIDVGIGHYRRYAKNDLEDKARKADFSLEKIFYFNAAGIPGWYVTGNILHKAVLSTRLLSIFDRENSAVRAVDRYLTRGRMGLSLVAVLRK